MNDHAIPAIVTIETKSASGVSRPLRRMLALDDSEKAAERYLPRPIFGYVSGGCETGSSFQVNRTLSAMWISPNAYLGTSATGPGPPYFWAFHTGTRSAYARWG